MVICIVSQLVIRVIFRTVAIIRVESKVDSHFSEEKRIGDGLPLTRYESEVGEWRGGGDKVGNDSRYTGWFNMVVSFGCCFGVPLSKPSLGVSKNLAEDFGREVIGDAAHRVKAEDLIGFNGSMITWIFPWFAQ
jgi:hypothetical protein